ncbi:hypothetical protein [Dyadobacter sp. CY356]|uniref:hypothetical protein n=1 Tax=Dyadobacter sp. CY356 TaxID=2906442 RepID=UPI001F21B012|nr:hypothetical protein [Dyadobacter sp. CY356]MCF0056289.1 hypothetical protein [Dyadobacter sp. CY356]
MEDIFEIDVEFKGEIREFEGRLVLTGYEHKIEIFIEDISVFFEPDEERNYRAIVGLDQIGHKNLSPGLLQAIAQRLESLLK